MIVLDKFSRYVLIQLAVKHGVKFFETSALSGQNVEEAFLTMAGDIKKKTEKKLVGSIADLLIEATQYVLSRLTEY